MFNSFDQQKQRFITKRDIDDAFKQENIKLKHIELTEIFDDLDKRNKGKIYFQDFQ